MARVKVFYVLPARAGDHGQAEVRWQETSWDYLITARTHHNVMQGTALLNEAGFRGRQWELSCEGIGDNQFATLREAAQAVLSLSNEYTRTREMVVRLGLVKEEVEA